MQATSVAAVGARLRKYAKSCKDDLILGIEAIVAVRVTDKADGVAFRAKRLAARKAANTPW